MKAVVAAFDQEKALVGAFSVITNLRMELFEALVTTYSPLIGQVRDVAEYLHFLLTNRNILGNAPPVLIVCNKQDSGMAKGKGAVQTLLEKEIEKVSLVSCSFYK